MSPEPLQVAHVGLGAIGREVVRLMLHRRASGSSPACDVSPDARRFLPGWPRSARTWRRT